MTAHTEQLFPLSDSLGSPTGKQRSQSKPKKINHFLYDWTSKYSSFIFSFFPLFFNELNFWGCHALWLHEGSKMNFTAYFLSVRGFNCLIKFLNMVNIHFQKVLAGVLLISKRQTKLWNFGFIILFEIYHQLIINFNSKSWKATLRKKICINDTLNWFILSSTCRKLINNIQESWTSLSQHNS